MNGRLFLYVCWACMFFSIPVAYADEDCDLSLLEAQQAYNAGDYANARALFEYVAEECGANYGNVTEWINKCKNKLTPSLSVSPNSISVSANEEVQYITVTSNVEWEVQHPSGDMYRVTRNGNTLAIMIYQNPSFNSRIDYFNVKTVDGRKNVKIDVKQAGRVVPSSDNFSSFSTPVEEEDNTVFMAVEQMPEFPGGSQELFKYLNQNIHYPDVARDNGIQGRVICRFTVNRDGSLVDIRVVRSSGDVSLDKEAIRVIRTMPKWSPGKQRGKTVRVNYTIPVTFKLVSTE